MYFCDEEHELNHELCFISDDSRQKHVIASSTQLILNCIDRIIQQNHGLVWGSHLQRFQKLIRLGAFHFTLVIYDYPLNLILS